MKKILAVILSIFIAASVIGCSSLENASSAASSSAETSEESSPSSDSDSVSSEVYSEISADSSSASEVSDADTYALPAGSSAAESAFPSSAQVESQQIEEASSVVPPASSAQEKTQRQEALSSTASTASSSADLQPDNFSGSSISMEEYDKIQDGMTYEQVEKIIGGSGKLQSTFGTKGTSFYTVIYRWKGYGAKDAYADLTFQDGKLTMKIQFGLK